jgi:hypothetical protein
MSAVLASAFLVLAAQVTRSAERRAPRARRRSAGAAARYRTCLESSYWHEPTNALARARLSETR